MIIETQAVGPFFKNGFVLGCEETREAVLTVPVAIAVSGAIWTMTAVTRSG